MIICADRRNLQKDKHHCNTDLGFMAVWRDSILSSVKTHENTLGIDKKTHKGSSDWETRFSGLMNLHSKHHVWRKPAEYHPKSKVWWCSKACRTIPKNTWGCKFASAKYWVKGMNTYAMYFSFFLFVNNLQSWDSSVFASSLWCMECRLMWKKGI